MRKLYKIVEEAEVKLVGSYTSAEYDKLDDDNIQEDDGLVLYQLHQVSLGGLLHLVLLSGELLYWQRVDNFGLFIKHSVVPWRLDVYVCEICHYLAANQIYCFTQLQNILLYV